MIDNKNVKSHWSFWLVGGLALIWNALGSVNFIMQMNADKVSAMPEAYQAFIEVRPMWATAAFAIAVFGGVAGCLFLLLKKPAAIYIFVASLLGVSVTMLHALSINSPDIERTQIIAGTSMSLIIAAALIWYTKMTQRKSWISGK